MSIKINMHNNLGIYEAYGNKLDGLLSEKLSRFNEQIALLEVHLPDSDGPTSAKSKQGFCSTHLEDTHPIVMILVANNYEKTVHNAIDKLKTSLRAIFVPLRHY